MRALRWAAVPARHTALCFEIEPSLAAAAWSAMHLEGQQVDEAVAVALQQQPKLCGIRCKLSALHIVQQLQEIRELHAGLPLQGSKLRSGLSNAAMLAASLHDAWVRWAH